MNDHRRIAVLGAGAFGRNHLRVVRESGRAVLAGVLDTDAARAQAAAAEFGCPVLKTLEDVAAAAAAAIVAVPTVAHCEVVCRLLDEGLDVLVEKPIAASVGEARAMVEKAAERGRVLQCGHLERFNPAVQAALRVATIPLFFEIHRLSLFTPRSLDVSVVSDLMIHDLDILLSMTASAPDEVRAAGISVLSGKVDIANVRLSFPNGCPASTSRWITPARTASWSASAPATRSASSRWRWKRASRCSASSTTSSIAWRRAPRRSWTAARPCVRWSWRARSLLRLKSTPRWWRGICRPEAPNSARFRSRSATRLH
jgi:predicted dehydrogenase